MTTHDEAREVRAEDAFDVRAVDAWLRANADDHFLPLPEGEPAVRQFPGGASNLTYLLTFGSGEHTLELILRRPPSGAKAKSAHDMGREFRIQSALRPVFPLVPRMVGFCADDEVIGSDFYVMERLDGIILRQDLPDGLTLDEAQARDLCERFIDVLVALHEVDVEAAGLTDLGKGAGYVARQVSGWTDRFARARTPDVGDYATVTGWLAEHQPEDVATCLIHNDFRFDNVVLDDDLAIIGVLDWEMATLGDPLMDLGAVVSYWTQADDDEMFQLFRRQPTHVPGMLTRAEVWDRYAERTGRDVPEQARRYYEVFGLFRLGVIAQQIYYRYFHGQTTNEAYAVFGQVAAELEARCLRIIETGDGNASAPGSAG